MEYTPDDFFDHLNGNMLPFYEAFPKAEYGGIVESLYAHSLESGPWVKVRFPNHMALVRQMEQDGYLDVQEDGFCKLSATAIDLLAKAIIPATLRVDAIDSFLEQKGYARGEILDGKDSRYATFTNGQHDLDYFVTVDDGVFSLEITRGADYLFDGVVYGQECSASELALEMVRVLEERNPNI
jgi:hypothetical protein